MSKSAKYILAIYASKKTVREAVKNGCFISASLVAEKDTELVEAQSVEFDPPKWSDEEEIPSEMGYKTPEKPSKKRKKK